MRVDQTDHSDWPLARKFRNSTRHFDPSPVVPWSFSVTIGNQIFRLDMSKEKEMHANPIEEPTVIRVRRLMWACRRGIRELDLLLTAFLERRYSHLSVNEQHIFENLLEYPDPLLYDYLMGRQTPTDLTIDHVIQQVRRIFTD